VQTQGYILGSFFYGYVITQLPGGRLAELFGGKWIFGTGVLVTSIFTLLTPIAAKLSIYALIAVRVFEGNN
jgi:ACS family sodium-dependent inorganic phosphate cotransporter-like MFS transporter 5